MTRWRLIAVLIAAMLLASFVVRRDSAPASEELAADLTDAPDLYMQVATVTQFDDDGSVRYRLAADEIRHFEAEDTTRLQKPLLTVHRTEGGAWRAQSNQGEIHYRSVAPARQEEIVSLRDAVVLERAEAEGRLRLTTESLYVYPERRFAETDQAVMIETIAGRTSAAGLVGDLNTGVLKLSSDGSQRVHTIVLPRQFKRATNV